MEKWVFLLKSRIDWFSIVQILCHSRYDQCSLLLRPVISRFFYPFFSEIFGNMRSSPSLSNGSGNASSTNPMQQQQTGNGEGFNPWASPTPGLSPFPVASNSVVPPSISTDSIFSSATKPNSTNPFL